MVLATTHPLLATHALVMLFCCGPGGQQRVGHVGFSYSLVAFLAAAENFWGTDPATSSAQPATFTVLMIDCTRCFPPVPITPNTGRQHFSPPEFVRCINPTSLDHLQVYLLSYTRRHSSLLSSLLRRCPRRHLPIECATPILIMPRFVFYSDLVTR